MAISSARGWTTVVVGLALCGACREEPGAPAPPVPPGPLPPPAPVVRTTNATLSCEALVPIEVRQELLADWNPVPEDGRPERAPGAPRTCAFTRGTPANQVRLAFDCRRAPSDDELARLKAALRAPESVELPALGRAAVQQSRGRVQQVTAWDDDSPCYLLVTWSGEGAPGVAELSRRVLAALTADLVKP